MATPIVKAQKKSKVELSIQLLIPNVLGERILDTELFTAWMLIQVRCIGPMIHLAVFGDQP